MTNPLFNVIRKLKQTPAYSEQLPRMEEKHFQASATDLYYLIALPLSQSENTESFKLSNHHLNIHANPLGDLDRYNQGHYSADLQLKSGETLHIHIFFDEENNFFISLPTHLKNKLSKQDEEKLLNSAQLNCSELLTQIRVMQNALIENLQRQYNKLELEQSKRSRDLDTNKTLFLSVLEKQVQLLEEMRLYSNSGKDIEKSIALLHELEENIGKKPAPITSVTPEETYSPRLFHTIRTDKIPSKEAMFLSEKLASFSIDLDKIKDQKLNERLKVLGTLLLEIEALDIDHSAYQSTEESRQKLKELQIEIKMQSLKNLQQLLIDKRISNRFKLAEPFYQLYGSLPPMMIVLVLKSAPNQEIDEDLLFFLSDNLKNQEFTLGNATYPSLLAYCFKNPTEQLSLKLFKHMLEKNGYDILLNIDSSTRAPYRLLINPGHPFYNMTQHTFTDLNFCIKYSQTLLGKKYDIPAQHNSLPTSEPDDEILNRLKSEHELLNLTQLISKGLEEVTQAFELDKPTPTHELPNKKINDKNAIMILIKEIRKDIPTRRRESKETDYERIKYEIKVRFTGSLLALEYLKNAGKTSQQRRNDIAPRRATQLYYDAQAEKYYCISHAARLVSFLDKPLCNELFTAIAEDPTQWFSYPGVASTESAPSSNEGATSQTMSGP